VSIKNDRTLGRREFTIHEPCDEDQDGGSHHAASAPHNETNGAVQGGSFIAGEILGLARNSSILEISGGPKSRHEKFARAKA
jgi:hypothetical protein